MSECTYVRVVVRSQRKRYKIRPDRDSGDRFLLVLFFTTSIVVIVVIVDVDANKHLFCYQATPPIVYALMYWLNIQRDSRF